MSATMTVERPLAEHIKVRELGSIEPEGGSLWPALTIVERVELHDLALVRLAGSDGVRQLGPAVTHDQARIMATHVLALAGKQVPAMLHQLALAYLALSLTAERDRLARRSAA